MEDGRDAGAGAREQELVGERVGGRFVLERVHARGAVATTFVARDERLERRVAVRVLHPVDPVAAELVDAQLELARAVARLTHEGIAVVIDRGEHDGLPFVVSEHVRGESLRSRMDRLAPLRAAEVVGIGVAASRALAYAHGHGVVHGNLRPQHLQVAEDGEVKLTDFGGATWLTGHGADDAFAAPERRGRVPGGSPTAADDIHGLGASLLAALLDAEPESGTSPEHLELLRPDMGSRLARALARSVAVDPGDRQATMRELAADLDAARRQLARGVDTAEGAAGAGATMASSMVAPGMTAASTAAGARPGDSLDDLEDFDLDEPPVPARRRGTASDALPAATTTVQPAVAADEDDPADRDPEIRGSRRRARLLAWSMVLVPLALLGLVGVMVAGERASEGAGSAAADGRPSGEPEPLDFVAATSFDPQGDGEEHDELLAGAVDGDPETYWDTEGYGTADMGDKPGVGLAFELEGGAAQLDTIDMRTDIPGFQVEIYGADGTPATLEGWTQVGEPQNVGTDGPLLVDTEGEAYTHYLAWFTSLSLDTTDLESHRARVHEATATGWPDA